MQFNRIFRLIAGEEGGEGLKIESDGKEDSLRIEFEIDKDLTQQTNKSSIKIYNLTDDSCEKIEVTDMVCELQVGYAEDIGLRRIFLGNITYSTTRRDGPDKVTELEMADGQDTLRDTVVSLGYSVGVSAKTVLNDVAAQMGVTTQIAPDIEFASYPAGFSFVGKGRDCLSKILDASGATWSIQNGTLQVIMAGGSTSVQALVFSASSGLIGSPERIVKGVKRPDEEAKKKRKVKKDKKAKQAGWKIKTLLAPTVNPGDLVKVESVTIIGWFRVESLKHKGDTHGREWYSEMELIELVSA